MQHCVSNVLPTEQDMHGRRRTIIGVGGNIGAGKTTACKFFESLGARYISADRVGWEVLSEIADDLTTKFGGIIMDGKKIDKEKLRTVVFSNKVSLDYLNKLSHPILVKKILKRISMIKTPITIIDAALLFDWPEVLRKVDYTVLVKANAKLKAARARTKGIERDLFEQIMKSQHRDEQMAKKAQFIINNNGDKKKLKRQCEAIYKEIKDDC